MTLVTLIDTILAFIRMHGYFFIFISTIIEGPIVTTAAAFAASLGYFNVFFIFLLSVFGDLIGDTLHFFIGRKIRRHAIEKRGEKIGLSRKRLRFLERNFKKHLGKMIVFLKLMPPSTSIGLLLIGASPKIKYKQFISKCLIAIIPISLFYTLLGFFLGATSVSIFRYIRFGEYTLFFLLASAMIAYIIMKRVSRKVEKIENIEIKKNEI